MRTPGLESVRGGLRSGRELLINVVEQVGGVVDLFDLNNAVVVLAAPGPGAATP